MPFFHHETLVVLFRHRPALAGELVGLRRGAVARAQDLLGSARFASASLAEIERPTCEIGGVVPFGQEESPDRVVVVEVQRFLENRERSSWPALTRGGRSSAVLGTLAELAPVAAG